MNIQDDPDLVRKLQARDVEAFETTYLKYSGKLYAFGLKYLRSAAQSEELVQNTFVKVWENRHKLRPETSFKSYLFTIAYNDICKFFRAKKYYEKFVIESMYLNPHRTYSIDEKLDSQSLLGKVHQVIEKLPEKQKMVFLGRRLEGKSTHEIAEELGLSPGTVDNYILEANKILKRKLSAEELGLGILLFIFL